MKIRNYVIATSIFSICLYGIFLLINIEAMIAVGIGAIVITLADIEEKIK